MSADLILTVVALVFLILSFVWAVLMREVSALLFAVWAIAVIVVFGRLLGAR